MTMPSTLRRRLSERDAWPTALAWREKLQGCVRLETDSCADPRALVPVFRWVTFVLNGSLADGLREIKDTKDTAASARAATIAWFALSCCAGYSARENPHFWRRVFSELHAVDASTTRHASTSGPKKPSPYRAQRPISDAVRFFDARTPRQADVFPRVKFVAKFPQDSASVRAFLLASDGVDRKLQKLLKRLAPFICSSQWTSRCVPIAIEGLQVDELIRVMKKVAETCRRPMLSTARASPDFRVETIVLRRQDTRSTLAVQDLKTLTDATIVAENYEFPHLFHTQRGPIESLVNREESLVSVHSLSLARSIGSRSKFAAACSALPYIQAITEIELTSKRFEVKSMGSDDWAWLGYAVFHPDAATNCAAFSQLDVRLPYARDVMQQIEVFKSMAVGNNLLNALGYDAGINLPYCIATVRAGAVVRLDSSDDATLDIEMPSELYCTLCHMYTDRSRMEEWVQAVVPGFGLTWIRQDDIVDARNEPAARSCVRHLRLELPDLVNDEGELDQWIINPMLDLLAALGGDLISLDLVDSLTMDKATVRAIIERCPYLQTLRISHDGSLWENGGYVPARPRLEALELCIDATAATTSGLKPLCSPSLADLKALRLKTLQHESFNSTHRNFLSALATYPGILDGHWLYAGRSRFTTYDKRRLHSLSLQRSMDCGQSDVSQVPMKLDCKLAFLSVVHCESMQSSSLSALGPDVLSNLFAFSTSSEPRSIYIGCD